MVSFMTADREPLYWKSNKDWYAIDRDKDEYKLTDEAPERAIKSFELYQSKSRKDTIDILQQFNKI